MNPLDIIDVEIDAERVGDYYEMIDAERVGDYYEIGIDLGEFGRAEIRIKAWVMDAALDEAEATIEQGAEAWSELFDQLKEELND